MAKDRRTLPENNERLCSEKLPGPQPLNDPMVIVKGRAMVVVSDECRVIRRSRQKSLPQ